jgi:putative DNA primase/helicase
LRTKLFREGILSSDFITDTIPYDYKPCNPEKKSYLKSVLKKILNNNDEHLEYYLSIIGFSFIGTPDLEKSIYFMIDKTFGGKGDNGKTFWFDILNSLMPNYVYRSKASLIEKNNTKVHKQLVMTKGKRLVWLEELPKDKQTNAELMKEIGDGKQLENEIMFGTSETLNILFKMFILSNHVPKIDPNESAVYNRYKQVSFNSHFDRTGERTEEDPKKLLFIADSSLGDKIKNEYYNEVFDLIIEYAYKYYEKKIPKIPQQFVNDTNETKTTNDSFAVWFNDNCIIDSNGRVALKQLVSASGINEKEVKEGMIRLGFKYNKDLRGLGVDAYKKHYKGGFEGVVFTTNDIEDEEDEE